MIRREAPAAEDRRILRRRLLLWSALPALPVLCLAAKLFSVGILAGTADRGFAAGDAQAVADAATGLDLANFIEPHKAPFAAGDSLVLAGDFAAARQRFEEALSLAGTADACVIRVNLVLSIENLGDERVAAADPTAAARLFAEGLAVVNAAPVGCSAAPQPGSPGTGPGQKLDQAADRLEQKAADAGAGDATPQPAESPQKEQSVDPGRQSQLEQLEEAAREAQRERNTGQERDEYLRDEDNGSGPDQPW